MHAPQQEGGERAGFHLRPPTQVDILKIQVTPGFYVEDRYLEERFVHAQGPGGQNVNKVSTAVQLRFDAASAQSLDDAMRTRLRRLAGSRMNAQGVLIIEARRYRTRERNRKDALDRLLSLLRRAAEQPKPRTRTKPSPLEREKRLMCKHRRSDAKRLRRVADSDD